MFRIDSAARVRYCSIMNTATRQSAEVLSTVNAACRRAAEKEGVTIAAIVDSVSAHGVADALSHAAQHSELVRLAAHAARRIGWGPATYDEAVGFATQSLETYATLDLWETNAGGLILTDRAAGKGWFGFEMGQNIKAHRATPREEFTLATDGPEFVSLGEGSVYGALTAADVEALYDTEGDKPNNPVRVASWNGKAKVRDVSIGAAARWYLDIA